MSRSPTTRPAAPADRDSLIAMRAALWPESPAAEHQQAVDALLAGQPLSSTPLSIIVAESSGELAGFIEVDIRSHADGCDPTRPVGYVEGWYVADAHRRAGVGKALMDAAAEWAVSQGCRELASDALIENQPSIEAHLALGFEVVDRCINFRRGL